MIGACCEIRDAEGLKQLDQVFCEKVSSIPKYGHYHASRRHGWENYASSEDSADRGTILRLETGKWTKWRLAPLGPSGVVPAAVATATDSPQGWGVVQTP